MKELLDYYLRLSQNNCKPWFDAHRDEYEKSKKQLEVLAEQFISEVALFDSRCQGLQPKDCIYRIYRDIRFSPDKSPYKTYFSACFGRGGRRCRSFAHYVHLQPGNSMVGGGVWMPDKDKLCAMRSLIDAEPEEFSRIVNAPAFTSRFHFESDSLKRVPKDFPSDHPLGEYLKMKEYLVVMRIDDNYFSTPDWPEKVNDDLKALKPLKDFLDYVYDD